MSGRVNGNVGEGRSLLSSVVLDLPTPKPLLRTIRTDGKHQTEMEQIRGTFMLLVKEMRSLGFLGAPRPGWASITLVWDLISLDRAFRASESGSPQMTQARKEHPVGWHERVTMATRNGIAMLTSEVEPPSQSDVGQTRAVASAKPARINWWCPQLPGGLNVKRKNGTEWIRRSVPNGGGEGGQEIRTFKLYNQRAAGGDASFCDWRRTLSFFFFFVRDDAWTVITGGSAYLFPTSDNIWLVGPRSLGIVHQELELAICLPALRLDVREPIVDTFSSHSQHRTSPLHLLGSPREVGGWEDLIKLIATPISPDPSKFRIHQKLLSCGTSCLTGG
ncbi:hypothetical protein BDK51DRAFT_33481 [Blyttiomyces helicus]|uniref:Uncharacterized protein n=1 Tax=Blyttiomyces helicus TaxID=388810 RepID=A0A4P9VYT8_9FUNG|nr:hypothetical protein BDK51DRAFT_33481 [Blyttiomyces helicus]|eukprot:RKO83488.1 hypothetical protein BDK51DRAFT_33481 [Blyttiomyces helicus]